MKIRLQVDGCTVATRDWDGVTWESFSAALGELGALKAGWLAVGYFPTTVKWRLDGLPPGSRAATETGPGPRPAQSVEDTPGPATTAVLNAPGDHP